MAHKKPEPKTNALADAVVAYLDLLDGPSGSQRDYQEALDNIVAALPATHTPASLEKGESWTAQYEATTPVEAS